MAGTLRVRRLARAGAASMPRGVGRIACVGFFLLLSAAARADALPVRSDPPNAEIPRVARDVINETMSPYCPGLLLANCPSPAADTLRRAIVSRALAGESRERLSADLIATYGESVRAAPRMAGLGLVAWLAPAIAMLMAGGWLILWLRPLARRPRAVVSGTSSATIGSPGAVPALEREKRAEGMRRIEARVRRDDG